MSVAIAALLLLAAELLAAHLKRSEFSPSRREHRELPVRDGANSTPQRPAVVLHT